MAAQPDKIWDLVSDVTQVGKFSPETFEAKWIDGSTGPEVGARFKGHVRRNGRGPVYWTTCKVTVCDPEREFTFAVVGRNDSAMNTWSYRLRPEGDGTDVTESFQLGPALPMRLYWGLLGWTRGKTNERGMRSTLEGIKAMVESPARG
jgi:hypothetical protein